MKKYILPLLLLSNICFAEDKTFNEKFHFTVMPSLGYLSSIEEPSPLNIENTHFIIESSMDYVIDDQVAIAMSIIYGTTDWSADTGYDIYNGNFSTLGITFGPRYYIPISDKAKGMLEMLIGAYKTEASINYGGASVKTSETNFGMNFGGGAVYSFSNNFGVGGKLKFHYVNYKDDYWDIALGPFIEIKF